MGSPVLLCVPIVCRSPSLGRSRPRPTESSDSVDRTRAHSGDQTAVNIRERAGRRKQTPSHGSARRTYLYIVSIRTDVSCPGGGHCLSASALKDLGLESIPEPIAFDVQIVARLEIQPEPLRRTEVPRKS